MKVTPIAGVSKVSLSKELYKRIRLSLLARIAEYEHEAANVNFHITSARRDLAGLELEALGAGVA